MNENILEIKEKILDLVKNYSNINFQEKEFVPGVSEVPVSGKVIGALELQNMVEASLDGWLTTGRFNQRFEERLSKFLGIKCLLTVNSGSSAKSYCIFNFNFTKLKDRAIQKGDEVISVAAWFPTTVNPIVQFGAIPDVVK
jgi:CDP-6-deoxy-D-xylo-4-hexulose-3-dehydrase